MYGVNEFRNHVDELTLENEKATRAGTLRMLLRALPEKIEAARSDKDTMLDYLKFMRELVKEDDDKGVTDLTVTFK